MGGRWFTIRQQGDHPAPGQVADDARVSVIAPPGLVINPDNPERVSWGTATAPNYPKKRILAHRQH